LYHDMVIKRTDQSHRQAGARMKHRCLIKWLLILSGIGLVGNANACEYPPPPEFAKIAATATRVFVFRVMGLKVREQSVPGTDGNTNYSIWAEADVLVQKTFRGETANVTTVRFYNGYCGGVNLLIGHHYLIASNQTGETVELAPGDRSLGDVDPLYDPTLTGTKNLESNKYVIATGDALDGKQLFDSVLDDAAYRSLATVAPPPEIKIVTEPCKPKPKPTVTKPVINKKPLKK